jgi:hypothetical protein
MATRSRQTFAKRQKEIARKEKQERKAQRRTERKLQRAQNEADGVDTVRIEPFEEEPRQPS